MGVLLGHGQVHGRDGRQGHHLVGNRVRWPGPQERVIEGRSKLQCRNCWGTPLASSPSLSLVVRDQIRWACCWTMAKSPGGTADRGHHLVGNRVRWPGPQERVIEGRSKLQCCNCWGTPLAGSPSLSLVVRDQIRWACCWTMAKCPGGTADRAITWWATRSGGLAPRDG
ncbi:hypothetical protein C0708_24170 (plasmid) [Aeromonas caviae]|nr:hypothetical protein C0708_24170 [Aeromonas caviae]